MPEAVRNKFTRLAVCKSVDRFTQPVVAKFSSFGVDRFGHAVGEKQQRIAVLQSHLSRFKFRVAKHPERQSRMVQLALDAVLDQQRRQMAGVDDLDLAPPPRFTANDPPELV